MTDPNSSSYWRLGSRSSSHLARYAVAVVTAIAAIGITLWLAPFLSRAILTFFLAAVALSAWRGGMGPGLVTLVLSTVAIIYFLILPVGASDGTKAVDALLLAMFVAVASLVTWTLHSLHRSERHARAAAEEAVRLASLAENQAVEMEQQVEEANLLSEQLEESNARLRQSSTEAENARAAAEASMQGMRASERLKTAILDISLDCVVTMDHHGVVTEFNAAAERTFGYRRDEAVGKRMADLIIPPAFREAHRRGLQRYLATGVGPVLGKRLELPAVRRDGTEFLVELAIIPLPVSGDPVFTGFIRDITDRKRAEEERSLLLERERAARAEAETANRAKSDFLATMSHELRTPLNAIGGFAELMELGIRGEISEEQRDDLRRIRRNQQHLVGLISGILNFSQIESGQVHYQATEVRVHDLLSGLGEMIGPQAATKNVDYEYIPVAPDVIAIADREKLEQAVVNLLSNAVKFTEPGGRVTLSGGARGSMVAIIVRDTGIGIPEGKLAVVFEPFVQLDQSLTRRAEGTGLGLAISRDLARGMGGDLTVESRAGEGSTFRIIIPAKRSSAAA